jgi:tetratricopeptide (TPR) repeat protein
MTNLQYIIIGGSLVLFLVLYFGCETKPPGQQQVEQTRMLQTEATDVNILIRDAHDKLPADQMSTIQALQQELTLADSDSLKVEVLKQISGRWYENEYPAIAGHYAQEIAELEETEKAWSIAGTTYAICVQRAESDKVRTFCNQRAIRAFENAISLDPSNVSNQVNLALTYTEVPPPNEPMKGILMLRELEQSFPESALVLTSLARLAIQTGQFDRAIQRLNQALELENDNLNAICLLAQAYAGAGDQVQAQAYDDRCRNNAK